MSAADKVQMEAGWKNALKPEFEQPYFEALTQFVRQEYNTQRVYPPGNLIFNAFDLTPFDQVKVVLLGQDPYHGPGQAHGLCFSVQRGVPPPPSLQNVFKELAYDVDFKPPGHGDLTNWAEQGVLLLNTTLTVREGQAGSHRGKGWERLTDAAIRALVTQREHLVFLLWGRDAQSKEQLIDPSKHLILMSPHPSPLSAHRGFFGSQHFSEANAYLEKHGEAPINWQLPQ